MARDDVTTTKLTAGLEVVEPAGVAINTTNGSRVLFGVVSGSAAGGKSRRVVLRITNTAASTKVVTIPKGPAAQDAADIVTAAIAATTGVVYVAVGTKYVQADGGIYVNFVAGHTGVVQAFEMPAGG